MWNLKNKINKHNKNRLIDEENRELPDKMEVANLGEKLKGLRERKSCDTDNSMVIAKGKRKGGGRRRYKVHK